MRSKPIYGLVVLVALAAATVAQAGKFTDEFETTRNYLTQGVAGSGWDGFVGLGAGETVTTLSASGDHPGQLYLASATGTWSGPSWTPLGPFLYKVVQGDFVATVQVADYAGTAAAGVLYNNCGLMARAVPSDTGGRENWVSIDYFPLYSVGNIVRYARGGTRSEDVGGNGMAWNGHKYLQLQRVGNTFTFRTSEDGATWVDYPDAAFSPLDRADLQGLTLQVGVHQATFSSAAGYAAFDHFSIEGPSVAGAGTQAFNPTPANKATDVRSDIVLSWSPVASAVKRDVYFGASFADVNAATRDNPVGVLASQGQDANAFDPAGALTFGQTYYWRIDEVNAAPDSTIFRGPIWSFTAEPYGYPIKPVKATASSSTSSGTGPDKTIDGSGLTDGMHSTSSTQMWLSKKGVTPVWIQYEFSAPTMLYQMWVWNSNQVVEPDIGYGAKDVTIETSVDGTTWTALAGVPVFSQATGEPNYTANTTVDFGGTQAKYVKLTVNTNWGGAKSSGLSEVQFTYVPVVAREPKPASGATGVGVDTALTWRPGRQAVKHEVYFSTNQDAVSASTALAKVVTESRCRLMDLGAEYGQIYYWKVNEVNDAANPKSVEGSVWSLSTPDYFVVEDFDKYDNLCNRIFFAWVDGFGYSASQECGLAAYGGNGTGSTVGNANPPFAERTIVHGGRQSMPFFYDNTMGKTASEAERTLAVAQDWTPGGLKTLVLFFRGDAANTTGQLYVKINGTRVDYKGGAEAMTKPLWKQWNIDLATVGTNLKAVKTLAVGVSGSGKGILYVDDIRLYRSAPPVVQPADPGTSGLSAYYAMEGDAKDSSGKGNHGTLQGAPTFQDGPAGFGRAIQLGGVSDYVELPIGSLISSLSSATLALRVNVAATGNWQRIFDFGNSSSTGYMFLSPTAGSAGSVRFAITKTDGNAEDTVEATATLSGWHAVAVSIDGASKTMQLYIDGELAASGSTAVLPSDLGKTTQNWIGRSQYDADAYFSGGVDEFRIYNRVLSAGEVRYLAGDR